MSFSVCSKRWIAVFAIILCAGDPEKQHLAMFLARNLGVEEDAEVLSTTITGLRTDLEALQSTMNGIESRSLADHAETLQAIAEGKNVLLHYLAGGTLFSDGRTDYVCANLESYAKTIKLAGASALVARYAQNITSYSNERREKTLDTFGAWLADNGVGTYDGSAITFTRAETLWNNLVIPQTLDDIVDWLYEREQAGRDLFGTQGAPDAVVSLYEQ